MKISIINGTNRAENRSLEISKVTSKLAESMKHQVSLITLENFTELFQGKYITTKNADQNQIQDLRNLIDADVILVVVPTYHHGIPASLKNFLDILTCNECFNNKVIGLISSNHSGTHGAAQAQQVLNGILSYSKLNSFIVPRINITDYDAIDEARLKDFIKYSISFKK